MVIWQGWGILVLVIAALFLVAGQWSFDAVAGAGYYAAHGWTKLVPLLLAGVAVGIVGTKLNTKPGRILIDQETSQQVELKTKHSLFFVPMQYWSVILAGVGVVMMFK